MKSLKVVISALGSVLLFAMTGCSAGSSKSEGNPPPTLVLKTIGAFYSANTRLNLGFAIAGQGSFQLLANGSGFTNSTVLEWNGTPVQTQFSDTSDLAANVPASLIAAPATATVIAKDTASGAVSNSMTFGIASPATLTAGVVSLITVASDGSPANGDSLVSPSISSDGRYVAFQSNATNLSPGPASGYQEIYERDTCVSAASGCTPSTIRITVTDDGSPVTFHSRSSAVSTGGRYVAFDSQATNILPATSVCAPPLGSCVFERDTCIGAPSGCLPTTFGISLNTQGQMSTGSVPTISADGRFVAFQSGASDIVAGVSGGQVYIRDTCIGAPPGCTPSTSLGSAASTGSAGNQNSNTVTIDGLGRFLGYVSWATNLTSDDSVVPGIFWHDTCTNAAPCAPSTQRVDVNTNGAQADKAAASTSLSGISPNGRFVAFGSTATNLATTEFCTESTGCGNIYVRDTCTGATNCTPSTKIVSLANDGSVANCNQGGSPGNQTNVAISADGRFVSFGSISTNLTPDDGFPACGWEDIFVRDTCFGAANGCVPSLVRVSVANATSPGTSGNSSSAYNAMSADGHYVVFISPATNFGILANGHAMVYLAKTGF